MRIIYILMIISSFTIGQEMVWQDNGIPIRQGVHIEWQRTICPGEPGSMIFVWSDTRYGSRNVFAQKIDSTGALLWGGEGSAVTNLPGRQEDPVAIMDGNGGAFISWVDYRFDDELNINDMGYQSRNNLSNLRTFTMYPQTDFGTASKILERKYTFDFSKRADTDGLQLVQRTNLHFSQSFKDTSGFEIKLGLDSSGKNDLLTRGSILAPFVKFGQEQEFGLTYYSRQNESWSYWVHIEKERQSYLSFTNSEKSIGLGGNYYPSDDLKLSMRIHKRESSSWINWLGDNKIGVYPLDRFSIRVNATWFPKENHELRIKFQTTVLEADTGVEWLADITGNLNSTNTSVAGFDLGQLAFQIRYKYEISPLSHFYAVYTRGGRHYEDDDVSVGKIISGTWDNPKEDRFTLKLRIKF